MASADNRFRSCDQFTAYILSGTSSARLFAAILSDVDCPIALKVVWRRGKPVTQAIRQPMLRCATKDCLLHEQNMQG
jgi:hypothetical protein